MSETPEPYDAETDGPQTLGEFMAITRDDLLATDIDTLQNGLVLLARRLHTIAQERLAIQDVVSRDVALRGESRALAEMKSCWQSILRTLRSINETA